MISLTKTTNNEVNDFRQPIVAKTVITNSRKLKAGDIKRCGPTRGRILQSTFYTSISYMNCRELHYSILFYEAIFLQY